VATGGKPRRTVFPGSNLSNVITSDDALELKNKPKSILGGGAGYIAVELASFFLQVGTDVTMAVRSILLKSFDVDIRDIIEDSLVHRGLKIMSGYVASAIEKIEPEDGLLKVQMKDKTTHKAKLKWGKSMVCQQRIGGLMAQRMAGFAAVCGEDLQQHSYAAHGSFFFSHGRPL